MKIVLYLNDTIYFNEYFMKNDKMILTHNYRNDEHVQGIINELIYSDNPEFINKHLISIIDLAKEWKYREYVKLASRYKFLKTLYCCSNIKKDDEKVIECKIGEIFIKNGDVLVAKTHPRIRFRGAMDTLEAELLLCGSGVEEILELARRLIRCEVMAEPVPGENLCGLTQQELRRRSHFPQEYYGQPHFMPAHADGEVVARLNRARCAARAAELAAVEAFTDREGIPTRVDILQALNRMSSMLYILMIQEKAKK